jgi:DNA (cytosine-5)-methyltransferase 1
MQVIDLFAGAGGLSLGAARAGFAVALAVEIDEHAAQVHKLNFPHSKHCDQSVAELSGSDLLRFAGLKEGELHGLIGGPPCQGFSILGRRNADDERNELFGEFFRLVAETNPSFFVAENVPNILSSEFDHIRAEALANIPSQYAVLQPFELNAMDFGAATNRKRVFFVGYDPTRVNGLTAASFRAAEETIQTVVGTALQGLPVNISSDWKEEGVAWKRVDAPPDTPFGRRLHGEIPRGVGDPASLARLQKRSEVSGCLGTHHSEAVAQRYGALLPGRTDRISRATRLDPDGFCPTLRAGTNKDRGSYQAVRPIHPTQPRVITPREAARLQGFPDWFQFHETKWHSFRQIGNSVSPILAEAVLRVLQQNLRQRHDVSVKLPIGFDHILGLTDRISNPVP